MRILIAFFICLLITEIQAQSYWEASQIPLTSMRNDDAMFMPNRFFSLKLNDELAKNELANAVDAPFASNQYVEFALPMPNGNMVTYHTYESPVMQSGLAAKYPSIKTYKGISADGKSIARFGYGPSGFHASIRTLEGEIYIDQVSKTGGQYYVSYFVSDHGEPLDAAITRCGTSNTESTVPTREPIGAANRNMGVELHTYRLALACTGVWGRDRGTKEKALEDMVTSVNRLNQIYENEAAFRLVLIDGNDKLIHLDPATDGYINEDQGRELIGQNTGRINALLGGNTGYDLGHIYTKRCTDVGGVAALGSMCANNKGAGVTCHYTNLLYITVQVAAHEVGHQLSAQHTFNNCSDANGDNANASLGNDFEPGSGSTIMSYGGLCGSNNVQGNNDDYYNNGSLVQIYEHLRVESGGAYNCAARTPTTNIAPEINIPLNNGFYIPKSSYFVLTGEATDENGDNLTYSWEGHDAGNNTCTYGDPTGSCPLFRSLQAKEVPYRFFPREQRIISNSSDISEILPTYSRELEFAFTVRDNNPEAGIAVWEYIQFNVDDTAGPFKALSPTLGEEHEVGSSMPVTWDVANTDNELVNCKTVDIYLSIDQALHVSDPDLILLAEDVPNIGMAEVILPLVSPTNNARILVKAHNNIFFDITDFNFKVLEASNPIPYFSIDKSRDDVCLPGSSTVDINTAALAGYTGNVRFEAVDLPSGVTAIFSNNNFAAGDNISATFDISSDIPTGSYEWSIMSISDNDDTISRKYYVDVISTNFDDLVAVGPDEGLKDSPGLPVFNWSSSFNADQYLFQISSNPAFRSSDIVYNYVTQDTFFETPDFLEKSSVFYWRVKAQNVCGDGDYSFIRSLGTVNLDCEEFTATDTPMNITSSGAKDIISKINVTSSGVISDLNIKNIRLDHDFFKDLTGTLTSPTGTSVRLFTNSCSKKYNMNITFDDDSPKFFNCENGVTNFKTIEELAAFNGEDPLGTWELLISDNKGGNGGVLRNVTLDICGSIVASAPVLVKNETIQIQPNNKPRIGQSRLLTEDDDNAATDLIYTLVYNVSYGELLKNDIPMKVGDTFTQEDINQARIFYNNTDATNFDSFYFTVEDGNGGWINITRFNIEIDESFPSSTNDPSLVDEIQIYPNPTAGFFNINVSEKARKMNNLQVMDIHGRLIIQQRVIEGLQRVAVPNLLDGVYLVKITDGKDAVIKRIIIQNK